MVESIANQPLLKPEAGYMKKLFLIDPNQTKIPTDSYTDSMKIIC